MDERKRMGWKVMAIGSVLFAISVWVKRYVSVIQEETHRTTKC
jgi:cytochrome c1